MHALFNNNNNHIQSQQPNHSSQSQPNNNGPINSYTNNTLNQVPPVQQSHQQIPTQTNFNNISETNNKNMNNDNSNHMNQKSVIQQIYENVKVINYFKKLSTDGKLKKFIQYSLLNEQKINDNDLFQSKTKEYSHDIQKIIIIMQIRLYKMEKRIKFLLKSKKNMIEEVDLLFKQAEHKLNLYKPLFQFIFSKVKIIEQTENLFHKFQESVQKNIKHCHRSIKSYQTMPYVQNPSQLQIYFINEILNNTKMVINNLQQINLKQQDDLFNIPEIIQNMLSYYKFVATCYYSSKTKYQEIKQNYFKNIDSRLVLKLEHELKLVTEEKLSNRTNIFDKLRNLQNKIQNKKVTRQLNSNQSHQFDRI